MQSCTFKIKQRLGFLPQDVVFFVLVAQTGRAKPGASVF